MRVNKDLADAVMMVSFIILVLVGTTTFDNETTKLLAMGAMGTLAVVTGLLRFIGAKGNKHHTHAF